MSSDYHSTSHECTESIVDLEDTTLWPAASSWATEPLDYQISSGYDSGMPRSVQRDLAEIDLALANDGTLGPTVTKPLDGMIPTFNFDPHFSPVPMARTTSDISGYRSTQTPDHPRNTRHEIINRKRDYHQVDMGFSQSYSHSPAHWSSTGIIAFTHQPRIDEVQVYEPGDYCSKLRNEAAAMSIATKKQRVSGFDESQPFTWSSTPNMYAPLAHNVAPSANLSSAVLTTHLSPCSLTSSEALSRQSSVTSASVTDAFDMMRVESSFSTASALFPLDQIDGSFVSCVTEKPASNQSTTGLNDDSHHSLSVAGFVGANPFSFCGHDSSAASNIKGRRNLQQRKSAHNVYEGHAEKNAAIELKASQRRRKHIDNSRQCIAPKRSSKVQTARSAKPRLASGGSDLWQGPTSVSTSRVGSKSSVEEREPDQPKEAISKTPYLRPQHPKLYCNMCEDSSGFRGEHELRRHWDREHAQRRRVWICLQPSTRTEWWPAKPLSSCKQCKQQKHYNVYYNAAAHLRRAHFCPRKRGRKAKGEERESRAGKAGGDWPPIDWLKANGWLEEIEVDSSTQNMKPAECVVPETLEEEEGLFSHSIPHESFAMNYLLSGDPNYAHPTMQYDADFSVPVQETVFAPPRFPSTDAMRLYVAYGYAF